MTDPAKTLLVTLTLADLEALLDRKLAAVASPALPRFLTGPQCAQWLDCTPQAISQWCREEGMPHVQLGRERRFEPAHVVAWMRSRGHVPADLPAEPTTRHLRPVRGGRR